MSFHMKNARGAGGYTLLELLLGVAIFSIVTGVSTMAFMSAVQAQRNIIAEQNLGESTRFAIEYMSRQLRLPLVDTTGTCAGVGKSYWVLPNGIYFINSDGNCVAFILSGGQIKMEVNAGPLVELTSASAVSISSLSFVVHGESRVDTLQPRVTIIMFAQGVVNDVATGQVVPIQTTVSARAVDVPQS